MLKVNLCQVESKTLSTRSVDSVRSVDSTSTSAVDNEIILQEILLLASSLPSYYVPTA